MFDASLVAAVSHAAIFIHSILVGCCVWWSAVACSTAMCTLDDVGSVFSSQRRGYVVLVACDLARVRGPTEAGGSTS